MKLAHHLLSRRRWLQGAAAAAGHVATSGPRVAAARPPPLVAGVPAELIARPPAGFAPLTLPGRVAKAAAKGDFASIM